MRVSKGAAWYKVRHNHALVSWRSTGLQAAVCLSIRAVVHIRQLHFLRADLTVKLAWDYVPTAALLPACMAATPCSWQ